MGYVNFKSLTFSRGGREGGRCSKVKKNLKNNKQKIVATSCAQLSQSFVMTTNQLGLQEKRK